jgi:ABC-type lipoprotein release transport system permease subunit
VVWSSVIVPLMAIAVIDVGVLSSTESALRSCTFAVVSVVSSVAAAAATLVPAVRATRVSPLEAIRTD